MKVLWPNFKREIDGIKNLILVVVQHFETLEILMVAFTDEEGWKKTIETGKLSLYSTSRKKSWIKGEESGNFMEVRDIRLDCDGDTILCKVKPCGDGVACHTKARTCFYQDIFGEKLTEAPKEGENERLWFQDHQVFGFASRDERKSHDLYQWGGG